jgi:hypothetical protein
MFFRLCIIDDNKKKNQSLKDKLPKDVLSFNIW